MHFDLLQQILIIFAIGVNQNPLFLVIPATIAASCAFMLPVATGPNAIVFGTGKITVKQMVREGLALNIIGVLVISSVVYYWLG